MVTNSVVSNNSSSINGGGIAFADNGTLTVTNSVISANASASGGGIHSDASILTVINSAISSNTSGNGEGGGIASNGGAQLTVTSSVINGNSAGDSGGGISEIEATLTVMNSTISGNSADNVGGGISAVPGQMTVTNNTISGNSATNNGGGIFNSGDSFLTLTSTVLNAGASGGTIVNDFGIVISLGYNLASDDGGGVLNGPGDQINTDPMLGPLQDNGGPTFTHALLRGSPAINAGDPSFTPPPPFDQRGPGFRRVANGRIDIGSFEVQAVRATPTPRPAQLRILDSDEES
jgi:hypothetical protein